MLPKDHRQCDGCDTPKATVKDQWWLFLNYTGPHGQAKPGQTLTGYYCPTCSSKVYDVPGFFEQEVIRRKVTKRLER